MATKRKTVLFKDLKVGEGFEFGSSPDDSFYLSMERGPFVKVSPRKYRPRDSGAKLRALQKIHEIYKLRPAKLSDLDMQVGSINVEVVRR